MTKFFLSIDRLFICFRKIFRLGFQKICFETNVTQRKCLDFSVSHVYSFVNANIFQEEMNLRVAIGKDICVRKKYLEASLKNAILKPRSIY